MMPLPLATHGPAPRRRERRERGRGRGSARTRAGASKSSWRSVLGHEGRVPNLYWGAMSPGSLRSMSYYTALPPPEQLWLEGEASYRYVRQGTPLWSSLHAGRLTTSLFKEALGMRGAGAAKLVGGPQHPDAAGVLKAYAHLRQPAYVPPPQRPPPPTARQGDAVTRQSATVCEAAQAHNEAARLAFNAELALDAGREGGGEPEPGWSEQDRRAVCEAAALGAGAAGATRLRLMWGSLQESSALATLAALFPGSQLEEVGLLVLTEPQRWGLEAGELPPMGASPDALITHNVPITYGDIEAARAELASSTMPSSRAELQPAVLRGGGGGGGGAAASASAAAPCPGSSVPSVSAARAAARSALRSALTRFSTHTLGATTAAAAVAATGTSSPAGTPPPPPPAPTAPLLLNGGGSADGEGKEGKEGTVAYGHYSRRSPPLYVCGAEEGVEWLAWQLLDPVAGAPRRPGSTDPDPDVAAPDQDGPRAPAGGGEGGGGGGGGGGDRVVAVVRIREVVEVKNHCPFAYAGQRRGSKRGGPKGYLLCDRGPHSGLLPLWVPQLQAHMGCAGPGVDSALLLSRSPSRGLALFRVFRDDSYLASMLGLVRELQVGHVAVGVPPPERDPWVGRPHQEDLLARTVELAAAAEVLVSTRATPQVDGTDSNPFWTIK